MHAQVGTQTVSLEPSVYNMGNLCPHRSPPVGGWYSEGKNVYKLEVRVHVQSDCSISAVGEMQTADECRVYFSHNKGKAITGHIQPNGDIAWSNGKIWTRWN